MASGTVKWFDETKGYGFIRPSDGGKDVFVHITAVRAAGLQTLTEGQKVNFELVTERGKIIPRRISGNCALHQRAVAKAVKQARGLALIPYLVLAS